jgi:hypothetical protein
MKTRVVMAALLLASCTSGTQHPKGVVFDVKPGVVWITKDGLNLGPMYIVGACAGFPDDPATNVGSVGSDGHTLAAGSPVKCPGSPFALMTSRTTANMLHVEVSVGPLPADYEELGIALDPPKDVMQEFEYGGVDHYWQGGCGISSRVNGTGGTYAAIPTPCPLAVLHSFVGLAWTRNPDNSIVAVQWMEARGKAKMRLLFPGGIGDLEDFAFINHPGSNNLNPGFHFTHKGQTVKAGFDLYVY